jgi:hypothetical protein
MEREYKEKVKKSMKELFDKKTAENGNPLSDDQLQALLPDWWKKLEAEGLTETLREKNFTYKNFVEAFLVARQRQELLRRFNINFG